MATPEEMAQTMRNNVEQKTGKGMNSWFEIITKGQYEKHGQIVKMLKTEFAVTHGFANLIAHDYLNRNATSSNETDLIETQYSGSKQHLKIIYSTIIKALDSLSEMQIAPKKSYISLRRNKQFALIQPSTKTRVDLGLNLKNVEPQGRLEASGSFNSMVSHRIKITDINQVDEELIDWLKMAYQQS
ncbi:DUF5655 domain-containing protein [Aliiglaciecola sp. 2_MG-2023]|uniref:DUF5655 domain-containing protein n=1 Tax=unclassified Aliiglaciecola TaxID=2593648 RepID=UPI0026E41D4F|nr:MULTISPECIES: DUF5655 domain-containing protein [unclassified Aliiglaciecola]MDO6713119.1 DUF5655 domain-containing protein [Aliiglaciecola sp. 2_MG-2023]MDO6754115.1 DUF5655 domain-containing protein [Aliiglaciecola sp. 1_MG-2023]